jgi:FMN phosphatase YigB (HAD superfamily)
VLDAFAHLQRDFVVFYADTMLNVDLRRMCGFHQRSPGITLFLHPNDHPQDSDLIEIDEANQIVGLHPYPHPPGQYFRNLVNAGLYVARKDCLAPWHERRANLPYPFDFGKHLFPEMIANGSGPLRGYVSREYIKDAGTPQRVHRVREDFLSGRIQAARWDCQKPAVFLGREGTLHADSAHQVKLLPGAAQAIRTVNESGRLAVVLSSQSDHLESLVRNEFESLLGHEGAFVDGMYACLPVSAQQPGASFFTKPAADLNIDIKQSWMIASGPVAIDAARKLGIHSILIQTSRPDRQLSPPDFVCQDVLSAVRLIAEKEQMPQ